MSSSQSEFWPAPRSDDELERAGPDQMPLWMKRERERVANWQAEKQRRGWRLLDWIEGWGERMAAKAKELAEKELAEKRSRGSGY